MTVEIEAAHMSHSHVADVWLWKEENDGMWKRPQGDKIPTMSFLMPAEDTVRTTLTFLLFTFHPVFLPQYKKSLGLKRIFCLSLSVFFTFLLLLGFALFGISLLSGVSPSCHCPFGCCFSESWARQWKVKKRRKVCVSVLVEGKLCFRAWFGPTRGLSGKIKICRSEAAEVRITASEEPEETLVLSSLPTPSPASDGRLTSTNDSLTPWLSLVEPAVSLLSSPLLACYSILLEFIRLSKSCGLLEYTLLLSLGYGFPFQNPFIYVFFATSRCLLMESSISLTLKKKMLLECMNDVQE